MSYESPITIAYEAASSHLNIEIENGVYKAVIKAGIDVNKDELIRALQYDRNQYEKGYADGQKEAVVHAYWTDGCFSSNPVKVDKNGNPQGSCCCSNCGKWLVASDEYYVIGKYCPNCGAKMDETGN